MTDDRNFYIERLTARIAELRQLHKDDDLKFKIEVTKLLETTARTPAERMTSQQLLSGFEALAKFT